MEEDAASEVVLPDQKKPHFHEAFLWVDDGLGMAGSMDELDLSPVARGHETHGLLFDWIWCATVEAMDDVPVVDELGHVFRTTVANQLCVNGRGFAQALNGKPVKVDDPTPMPSQVEISERHISWDRKGQFITCG